MEQRENQEHGACVNIEDESSARIIAKDFKNTLKYKDTESYASQHHHSIGTGLFLTDAIKDLPPRFRDKVIRALEEGAAVNNIPIERIPVESLFSVNDDSNQEKKNLDPLVICSSSVQDIRKSEKRPRDNVARKEYNAEKKRNSFYGGSNSNLTSNNTQLGTVVPLNVKNDNSNDSVKDRSHFKSMSHVSSPNLKKTNSKDIYHQKEKTSFQNSFSTLHLLPNSNFSNFSEFSEASHSTFPPQFPLSSISQKDNYKNETKKFNKRVEVGNVREKYDKSDFKVYPNCNSSPKHSLNSTPQKDYYKGETKKSSNFTESNNVKEKHDNFNVHKFKPICNNSPNPSLRSVPQKDNFKGETKKCDNRTESSNHKEKYDNSEFKKLNLMGNNSPKHSLSSVPQKDNYKDGAKKFNRRSESNNKREKYDSPEITKFDHNNCQDVPNPNSGKTKLSKNPQCALKQRDNNDSSNVNKRINTINSSCKQAFLSDASDVSSVKDKNRIDTNLPQKRTESHSVRRRNDSRCSSSSSHSSFSHYNKDIEKFPYESHKNLDITKDTGKGNFNLGDRSFSRANSTHSQRTKNTQKFCEVSENTQANFNDSSSQISNTPIRTQSSSPSVSKCSNNIHGSPDTFDKKFNKIKGNKTLSKPDVPRKQFDQEPLKQDFIEDSPKGSHADGNKNYNSQKSNYSKKSNTFNHKQVMHSKKNIPSEKCGIICSDSDQNWKPNVSKNRKSRIDLGGCIENGFFVKIVVSEEARNLEHWVMVFRSVFSFQFDLERCCHFSDILILELDRKEEAVKALKILWLEKRKHKNSKKPHIISISTLIYRLYKPCNCKQDVIDDSISSLVKHAEVSIKIVNEKIEEIKNMKFERKKDNYSKHASYTKQDMLKTFLDSKSNFKKVQESISEKIYTAESLKEIQQLKISFIRECNAFKRCLPIYSKKDEIMNSVRFFSVTVIIAETGSGKSTQLVEYLLHSNFSNYGRIICTQPRKLAAISIAQFVSGQLGSAVGKIVGYDVGMEQKCSEVTKIIYMTDYCLLKKFLRDPTLKDVSCIIIDEAHERSLYTDLVLGMLKKCIESRLDMRVIITSATINPAIFVDYFQLPSDSVIEVPGRSYPVDVRWWPVDVSKGWNYVDACVQKVIEIYTRQQEGDILVFLTSASEAEEAIYLFKKYLPKRDKKPLLLSLHGKSDIHEQMQVFHTFAQTSRRIIFATNVAETSVTIPGIKYVVDSGMTKDLKFDPKMNKSYLEVSFINKSAAEQRKGRAGRTQSGICYRMYSERNYEENMADNGVPEVLKTNLQKAVLKIFELGINPRNFNFIEAPPERTMSNSVDSLGYLGAIKNDKLTALGKRIAKLPVEPQLAKLILQGIEADIGYEIIIIAAMVTESGKLFIRNEENRTLADERRKKFWHEGGDLCTYLEIYSRWKEVSGDRFKWCVDNYISSKAMKNVAKTVFEIIFSLRTELGIRISAKFNNSIFKKHYENILFESFSENLCVSSGHPKLGYLSPYLPESFFIHPSSTVAFLGKDSPEFLVYTTLMETSRNFLFDITPISEETIKRANQKGIFNLPLHSLRCMQVPPKVLGPFGESVLVRYILGKQGSKIKELETKIQSLTNVKNAYIDVAVDKGLITVYSAQRFHEKVSKEIYQIIEKAHHDILKEEDVIKLWGTSVHFALSAGGLINDIIMPGEFRELIFNNVNKSNLEQILTNYGSVQSISHSHSKKETQITVTFKKVCDAQKAFFELKDKSLYNVLSKPYLPNINDRTLPLYILNISWCRHPCTGRGTVEFFSEEDLIVASGILTCKSFSFGNDVVIFTPSEYSKELTMKNLPTTIDEMAIRRELWKCLPDIKVKSVNIIRRQCSVDINTAKGQLLQLFKCYIPCTKVVIEMKNLDKEPLWKADAYFESLEDLENVFLKLKDKSKIDNYPLNVKRIFKSSLHCKSEVYKAVSEQVRHLLEFEKQKGVCEEFSFKQYDTKFGSRFEFTCANISELNRIRQHLKYFLLGESIDLVGTSKYNFLFSDCHREHIKRIQESTRTYIDLNVIKKVITIYGSLENCQKAKEEIYSVTSNPDLSFTRTFKLGDSCIPAGFLKELYKKYGFDLHGLVDEFTLTVAVIDNFRQTLTLKGLKMGIKKAEEALEELCEKLFKSNGERLTNNSEKECCPICFDPVSYDFQRLEHCGHAFCRQCLLLQLECKTIPAVCVKENCGKLIVLEDIKRIISFGGGDVLRKTFCFAALQYFVSCNVGKVSYCPTPDCQMIYRLTEEELEYICPACKNSTCTHCQAPYHYGMSCELFQKCQEDEDYSLQFWVKENEHERKHCPSCKNVIEKASGCNHMECFYCKVHFCWLCLKKFPSGSEVYNHLPHCPKNQGN